jgi:acetyl-CoA carboxylase alpha subunit
MAIGPWREKDAATVSALVTHDLAVFQIVDKIINFCDGGKAHRPESFKPIIYFFYFPHVLNSLKW